MCVRINNIHALITLFPSLESHVYSTTFSPTQRFPFSQMGASGISSTTTTESTSLLHSTEVQTHHHNPHRFRGEHTLDSTIQLLRTQGSDTDTSTVGLSPAQRRKKESGFHSGEAKQLTAYLSKALKCQLQLLTIRVGWHYSVDVHYNTLFLFYFYSHI